MSILQNEVSCLRMFPIVFRYNSTTGIFTVPPGEDGFYYFSTFLMAQADDFCYFDLEINGERLCTAYSDMVEDTSPITCSATTYATQGTGVYNFFNVSWLVSCFGYCNTFLFPGDEVQVIYRDGADSTPVDAFSSDYYTGFTGFRI